MFYWQYRHDLVKARNKLRNCGSKIAETSLGEIEYLDYGDGQPILWIHGIVGGADQGPAMVQSYLGEGFRVIAVSRFGYLQSPLPADASPAAQADIFASLLDVLGIEKVVLVGTSAGSASSLQFALRHPDRCAALVLWSMAVPPYHKPSLLVRLALRVFFGTDFIIWAMIKHAPRKMQWIMGVPESIQRQLTAVQLEWLSDVMINFLPTSARIKGIMNDVCFSNPGMNEISLFEQITVPKLIIHAVDDPMPPFTKAKDIAKRLPNASFLEIRDGGHLLLGHFDQVRAAMTAFIQQGTAIAQIGTPSNQQERVRET